MEWNERGREYGWGISVYMHIKRDYWFVDKTVYFMLEFRNNQKITPHFILAKENGNCQRNKCWNSVQICITILCAIMQRIRSFIFRPQEAVELHPISTHCEWNNRIECVSALEWNGMEWIWLEWNAFLISQFYAIISSSLKLDAIILLPFISLHMGVP